jgi:hypothetical protein
MPRWRRWHFRNHTYSNFQIADLVELNGLETQIDNRQCFAGDGIAHLELVPGASAFPHANEKFLGLTPNVAAHPANGKSDPRRLIHEGGSSFTTFVKVLTCSSLVFVDSKVHSTQD